MIQQEGPGWRLARDASRGLYSILIGGQGWALELTEHEWSELVVLVKTIEDQHSALRPQLMEEENIELELDQGMWWGCLEGNRQGWSLALVLSSAQGRGAEIFWPNPVATVVVAAMRTLWDSQH